MSNKIKRILVIGLIDQLKELKQGARFLNKIYGNRLICQCSKAENLERAIIGSETPEDKSTWNLPRQVLYSGDIKSFENFPVYQPKAIEETLSNYNLEGIFKIPFD